MGLIAFNNRQYTHGSTIYWDAMGISLDHHGDIIFHGCVVLTLRNQLSKRRHGKVGHEVPIVKAMFCGLVSGHFNGLSKWSFETEPEKMGKMRSPNGQVIQVLGRATEASKSWIGAGIIASDSSALRTWQYPYKVVLQFIS